MALPELLCECVDLDDFTVEAVCWIDARLEPLGIQLESASSDALQLALDQVLAKAKIDYLDHEGTQIDPNNQHRKELF